MAQSLCRKASIRISFIAPPSLSILWGVHQRMPSPILTWRSRSIPILYNHLMGKEQYQQHSFLEDPQPTKEPRRRQLPPEKKLREAIAPYMDVPKLRQLASDHERLEDALRTGDIPEEISWLLSLLTTV